MFLVVLNACCVVLFLITAILYAIQRKWKISILWALGTMCWIATLTMNVIHLAH